MSTPLSKFRNKHPDQRCVVVGLGASLNGIDCSLLKNEIVFGTNTIYRHPSIVPTYYVVTDNAIWYMHMQQILPLKIPLFIPSNFRSKRLVFPMRAPPLPWVCFFNPRGEEDFSPMLPPRDELVEQGLQTLTSVTLTCFELAYFMGFKKIILIGHDGGWNQQFMDQYGWHFDGSSSPVTYYFDSMRNNYSFSYYKHALRVKGVEVDNCTIGGNLGMFHRSRLEDTLSKRKSR